LGFGEDNVQVIYSVRHITGFHYLPAVRESMMEVRLRPRNEGRQRCLSFQLDIEPSTNVMSYRDFLGNTVHHFDIAGSFTEIKVSSQALVELQPHEPETDSGTWNDLDRRTEAEDHWEMLLPSQFACFSDRLKDLAKELKCVRRGTPQEFLVELNSAIYGAFQYVPNSTKVDSPIDEALEARQGVCQDFSHIMIALARSLRIPCRYVSGYLYHEPKEKDRSLESASHAWVEALLPNLGWTAFDPTNNLVASDRHIRVALGRDYADVPPTRGVYKGEAESELAVAVTVSSADMIAEDIGSSFVVRSRPAIARPAPRRDHEQQQQ
jgi:transglutaminase-like putative cysteine protease